MAGVIPAGRLRQVKSQVAAPAPPPSLGDIVSANWSLSGDRSGWNRAQNNDAVAAQIESALKDDDPEWYARLDRSRQAGTYLGGLISLKYGGTIDSAWEALNERRLTKPGFLPEVPTDRTAFDGWVIDHVKARRARDQRTAARATGLGQGLAGFAAGAVGGTVTDPVSLAATVATSGFAPAASILGRLGQQFLINSGIEAIEQPTIVSHEMALLGEPVTVRSAAIDILSAGIGGAVLGEGFHWTGKGASALARKVQPHAAGALEKVLAQSWDHLPESIRTRWASAADIPDHALPDLAEAFIGKDNLSTDEAAAISVLRREQHIDSGNPFVANGAGTARHAQSLGEAMQRIVDDAPPAPSRPSLLGSTSPVALTSGDAVQIVKNRIGTVESGGRVDAANPLTSARGLYQFTDGTWLGLYKRRFGADGLTDAQILARRSDPALQNRLMADLMADNGAMLDHIGAPRTAGNLYLAHFLGQRGARRVLEADPATPIEALVGREAVAANRSILEGKTAGDVVGWAHRRMNELPPAGIGARTMLHPDMAPREADMAARIQAELDRTEAEMQAIRAEQDAARAREDGEIVPDPPHWPQPQDMDPVTPVAEMVPERADEPPMIQQPVQEAQAGPKPPSPEVQALIAPVRGLIGDAKQSLKDVSALAEKLKASVEDVRATLDHLAARGELRKRKSGGYVRPPVDRSPVSALKFVARAGGLSDDEGHDLSTIFQEDRTLRIVRNKEGKIVSRPNTRYTGTAFIPGAGPIVRNTGHSLDAMGEKLWEAGYFGPPESTDRPSVDDVLSMLADSYRSDRPVYSAFDAGAAAEREMRAAALAADEQRHAEYDQLAADNGIALSDKEILDWMMLADETGANPEEALAEWVNRQIDDALWNTLSNDDRTAYALERQNAAGPAGEDRGAGSGGGGRDAASGNPRAGEAGGGDRADDPWQGWEPESLAGWDEPTDKAAEWQADSIAHDLDDMFGGPTQAEKRQALERRGDGGQSNGVDQIIESGDGRLREGAKMLSKGKRYLDPVRIDEAGGDRSVEELLREINAEAAEIDAMRTCL